MAVLFDVIIGLCVIVDCADRCIDMCHRRLVCDCGLHAEDGVLVFSI